MSGNSETYALFAKGKAGIAPVDTAPALRTVFKHCNKAEEEALSKGPCDEATFDKLVGSTSRTLNVDDVNAAFQVFDKVANGLVQSAEVRAELNRLSEASLVDIEDEDMDEMMLMMDPEKTGTIAYDAFVAKMMEIERFEGLPPLNPDDITI